MIFSKFRLGEICDMVRGTSPTLKTEPGPYPLVVTADFRRSSNEFQVEGPAVCIPLVSSTGHGDAALHRVHYQEGKFALANLLVALLPKTIDMCDARYLYHFLMTRKDQLLVPLMLGTANVSLKERDIAGVEVDLPPIGEQRRIVASIEALAAKIAEAVRLRRESLTITEVFSHAVGRQPFHRDASWPVVFLEAVCTAIVDCLHSNPIYAGDGIPTIRSPDVGWGRLLLESARRTDETEYISRTRRGEPLPGDIILVREGGGTGKAAIVHEGERVSLGQRVMMLRPDRLIVVPKFLLYQWLSPLVYGDQIEPQLKGSASPHLNIKALRKFRFVLPPLAEQHRIVAFLDGLKGKIDSMKQFQTTGEAELTALLPSALDKAFKGEL